MEYKVVPLVPKFNFKTASSKDAAEYLEKFINYYTEQGWSYVRVENISTFVVGNEGCFGFGSKPGYTSIRQMVVFSK